MKKFAVGLSYDGGCFAGWQVQPSESTVQGVCQKACAFVVDHEVVWYGAGRTDAGVHAVEMVAHFETPSNRTCDQIYRGMNSILPRSVRILWIKEVSPDFHARHSALSRSYTYIIDLSEQHRPFARTWSHWLRHPIDVDILKCALPIFVGEHDFANFRASGCQAEHARREIHAFNLAESNGFLYLNITANAFVYRMVRKLVGTLIDVAQSHWAIEDVKRALRAEEQVQTATAPAHGLHFMHAAYAPVLSNAQVFLS